MVCFLLQVLCAETHNTSLLCASSGVAWLFSSRVVNDLWERTPGTDYVSTACRWQPNLCWVTNTMLV